MLDWSPMNVNIDESWRQVLQDQFDSPYFAELTRFVRAAYAKGIVYPPGRFIFEAFNRTPFDKVKVVILGQDPYHGPGQAMGLSFSVPDGVRTPPSLVNIFKEIESDLGIRMSGRPNLESWAAQGVLLLNAVLTVRAGEAASHAGLGWTSFTDAVIKTISDRCEGVVFLLWGNYARSKAPLIDSGRHHILEAAHPSPLARGAFFGCRHFSKANSYLAERGKDTIDWKL